MTKEQTIKHLKLMQSGARNAIRFTKNDKEISEEERKEDIEIYQDQLEALEMAIKALEQQSSEDCVSRQAVLDNAYAYGNGLEPEGYCVNVEDIQALPPVTPTFPKDATNGDVIMAIFKEIQHYSDGKICADWWNAPYKRGNEKW